MLALHFATWVPSLRLTRRSRRRPRSCATQPVWVGADRPSAGSRRASPRVGRHRGLARRRGASLTGVDFSLDPQALVGDLLALLGGMFAALYTVAGAEVRRTVSTTSYTALCYGTCRGRAARRLPGRAGAAVAGFARKTWVAAAGADRSAPSCSATRCSTWCCARPAPTVVSLALLFEVPGAALIAALWPSARPRRSLRCPLPCCCSSGSGIVISLAGATSPSPRSWRTDTRR